MACSHWLRVALGSLLLASLASAQTVSPSSDFYKEFLQAGGTPFRVGNGFYAPPGCTYVVDYNNQCGGEAAFCNPASGVCADAQYPGACCPIGFTCQRQNAQYHQCVQSPPTYKLSTGSVQLQAFQQCGGTPPKNSTLTAGPGGLFVDVACPDGYFCTFKNKDYSLCTPNPQTEPVRNQSPYLGILTQLGGLINQLADKASNLAPGLAQYNVILPGGGEKVPSKTVEVTFNTTKLTSVLNTLLGIPDAAPPPPVAPPPPPPSFNFTVPNINFKPRPKLSIAGTELVDESGAPVVLHGVNWFGFETGVTMVDGLYPNFLNPRNFSQVGDFATVVYRQQALGFNAVRLPFRFADLNIAPPLNLVRPCSADSQEQIIGNLTNPTVPYYVLPYDEIPFPEPTAPIQPPLDVASSGLCNAYVPADTTLNRFLFVIQYFIGNGFYVTIDFHGQGLGETDRQIVANPEIFQSNWIGLLAAIQSLPTWQDGTLQGRLFFDLLNEPDQFNFAWNQSNPIPNPLNANSSVVPSWGDLYTSTAALLADQAPSLLFLVEGTGQKNQPGTAYGMGFGINPEIYTGVDGLYNALGGLQTILAYPEVRSRTIISPHIYGYQVTNWTIGNTNDAGLGLPYTYYNNFAYLTTTGVPDAAGVPQTFPVVVGEFGNTFNSSFNSTLAASSDPLSDLWIHDFAEFANNINPVNAARYPHRRIDSTFWWDWNANSLPPLGLVNNDPGNVAAYTGPLQPGWLTIQWIKINNLTDVLTLNPLYTPAEAAASGGGFGLRPWYAPPTTH